jgi:DNA-binding MarR family transcriptional regulator
VIISDSSVSPQHNPVSDTASRNSDDPVPVGKLLAQVNSIATRLRQKSRTIPDSSAHLEGAEHAVLEILERLGSLTVPQVARERSTSRQNIQILVDRLEAEGLVELTTNPAHKRSCLVLLTPKGRGSLVESSKEQRQILSQIGSQLSETEINAAVSVLRKIHGLLTDLKPSEDAEPPARFMPATRSTKPKLPSQPSINSEESGFPVNLL